MNDFKGTPGPWTIRKFMGEPVAVEYNWGDGLKSAVCVMGSGNSRTTTMDELEANTALISAAPELLEALQSLLVDCEESVMPTSANESITKAKSAIEKAYRNLAGNIYENPELITQVA